MENKPEEENKVYGMVLEVGEVLFLSIQFANSLEEAFNQARLEFQRLNPPKPGTHELLLNAKIGLFVFKGTGEMVLENEKYRFRKIERVAKLHQKAAAKEDKQKELPVEYPKPEKIQQLDPQEAKNMIMKIIIDKKDKKMFQKNKSLFNENEAKYLLAQIGKKKV